MLTATQSSSSTAPTTSKLMMADPPPEFLTLQEIVITARRNLSPEVWDYIVGGSDTETTVKRNRNALDRLAFRPRVLRNVENIDCGGCLLGKDLRLPVLLAPIGSLQDLESGGGVTVTKASAEFGTAHMLSSVCEPGLEAVAAAADNPKIFQLYVRGDADWVDDHVRRAIATGYYAFCLTVDLDHYGRRERDILKRHMSTSRQTAAHEEFQERLSWDDVKRIKDKFDIPLILKGIATAEDARLAIEHGVEGIYVSNHGGRQLDYGRGTIDVLPEVVAEVDGRAEILVDGGFMRGTDIVKAMILGADVVGIGRLQGFGAAAGGVRGVVRVLELLETEIKITLALLGVTGYDKLDAGYLKATDAVVEPHALSAFPLLDEGY